MSKLAPKTAHRDSYRKRASRQRMSGTQKFFARPVFQTNYYLFTWKVFVKFRQWEPVKLYAIRIKSDSLTCTIWERTTHSCDITLTMYNQADPFFMHNWTITTLSETIKYRVHFTSALLYLFLFAIVLFPSQLSMAVCVVKNEAFDDGWIRVQFSSIYFAFNMISIIIVRFVPFKIKISIS